MNVNQAVVVGRLTRDPELKALPSGSKVVNMSVATSRSYVRKDGTKEETTEFHNVIAFGATAETCGRYLTKGQQVAVTGRLQTRTWEKQDGCKVYRTEIIADNIQFGAKPQNAPKAAAEPQDEPSIEYGGENAPSESVAPAAAPKKPERKPMKVGGPDGIDYPQEDINPDDIPF